MTPLDQLKLLLAACVAAPRDDRALRAADVFDAYWRLTNSEREELQDDPVAADLGQALEWGRPHVPGAYYTIRGYRLDECLRAVGPGWEPLARRAWRIVRDASGTVVQVKEKFAGLVVYVRLPEGATSAEHNHVRARLDRIYRESRATCEWCGAAGRVWTPATAPPPIAPGRHPRTRHKTLCERHGFAFYAEGSSFPGS